MPPQEPVMLLHGMGCGPWVWAGVTPLLPGQVLPVHLAGHHGGTPLDAASPTSAVEQMADDLERQLDRAGLERAHLVGNSLGGAVAMRLAADEPSRAASLALVNSAGFGREVTVALRLLALRPLGRLLLRPHPAVARRTELAIFRDPAYATAERVATALAVARQPHAARVMLELVRSLGTWRGVRPQWRAELLDAVAALDVPALVVWGDRDLILPATHLAVARSRLPRARTHLFPDTGHMPQIERAEEFHALLRDFWTDVDRL